MKIIRAITIFAWIAFPAVMYGGYILLGQLSKTGITEFQRTFFRAGHAHAGVLLLMSLLFHLYLEKTNLPISWKIAAASILAVGILAQSSGFFIHMAIGQAGQASIGTSVTIGGAVLLVFAIIIMVYGLIATPA